MEGVTVEECLPNAPMHAEFGCRLFLSVHVRLNLSRRLKLNLNIPHVPLTLLSGASHDSCLCCASIPPTEFHFLNTNGGVGSIRQALTVYLLAKNDWDIFRTFLGTTVKSGVGDDLRFKVKGSILDIHFFETVCQIY